MAEVILTTEEEEEILTTEEVEGILTTEEEVVGADSTEIGNPGNTARADIRLST
jgi:hypothetical protein